MLAFAGGALAVSGPVILVVVARLVGLLFGGLGLAMLVFVVRSLLRPPLVARIDRLGVTPGAWPPIEWSEVEGVALRWSQGVCHAEGRVVPSWRARVAQDLSAWDRFGLAWTPGGVPVRTGSGASADDLRRLILWSRDRVLGRTADDPGTAAGGGDRRA